MRSPFALVGGLSVAALLTAGTLTAAEGETPAHRAIEFRESAMTILSWNMKPMGAMVKGDTPLDAAKFRTYAQDLAATAQLDILAGFPEGSDEGETDARSDIWMKWDDFKGKLEALRTASKGLADAAAAADPEKIKPAFAEVGKACKSCHEAYKD